MKSLIKVHVIICFGVIFGACAPLETGSEVNTNPPSPGEELQSDEQAKSYGKLIATKLMDIERRDKDGNLIGLNEKGLWYKRSEKAPYTGFVAGYYKAKEGKKPVVASVREYIDGVQVGTETSYYSNGNKRIELTYEVGEAVSMKQWDLDGKEFIQ